MLCASRAKHMRARHTNLVAAGLAGIYGGYSRGAPLNHLESTEQEHGIALSGCPYRKVSCLTAVEKIRDWNAQSEES